MKGFGCRISTQLALKVEVIRGIEMPQVHPHHFRLTENHSKDFEDFCLQARARVWPWLNLALTILYVPHYLESGPAHRRSETKHPNPEWIQSAITHPKPRWNRTPNPDISNQKPQTPMVSTTHSQPRWIQPQPPNPDGFSGHIRDGGLRLVRRPQVRLRLSPAHLSCFSSYTCILDDI